jgi:hypothetical protein
MRWGCDRRESLAAAGMNAANGSRTDCLFQQAGNRHDGGEREQEAGAPS